MRRKRGNQNQEALGRSRGGFSTKIHLRTNAKGNHLTFDISRGEVHEVKAYDALMELHDVSPENLLGDKGYDSDAIRHDLAERGMASLCQPSTFRMLIWPEASKAHNSIAAVSADGNTVCGRVKVKSRSQASCRPTATVWYLSRHLRMKALRRASISSRVAA